ncbi:MAG: hypothetical protein EXS13_05180 [Planctomycetes bacterium]|nr:hypothetical protein [Planctomycetota bacterium]
MLASVSFPCPQCQVAIEVDPNATAVAACPCGRPIALHHDAIVEGAVVACPACGETLLYKQKDFRQAVGCIVVIIAAFLALKTNYVSLGVAALIDWLLYRLSGEVVICYRIACKAHVRGLSPGPKIGAFDLSIHDYYRMLARREEQGLTGPDDQTGPPLDSRAHH